VPTLSLHPPGVCAIADTLNCNIKSGVGNLNTSNLKTSCNESYQGRQATSESPGGESCMYSVSGCGCVQETYLSSPETFCCCMHAHRHACVHACVHAHALACTQPHLQKHTRADMHASAHTNTQTHAQTQVYFCTLLSMHTNARTHARAHTRIEITHFPTHERTRIQLTMLMRQSRAMPHVSRRCHTLQHTATHCNTHQHTLQHPKRDAYSKVCIWLHHAATHCDSQQHTATHCNTLHLSECD